MIARADELVGVTGTAPGSAAAPLRTAVLPGFPQSPWAVRPELEKSPQNAPATLVDTGPLDHEAKAGPGHGPAPFGQEDVAARLVLPLQSSKRPDFSSACGCRMAHESRANG
jgi:hypothetical protein